MKVSVITINYNNHSGLHKTIRSVFDQSFSDYEYLIIDGGSTDQSSHVILSFLESSQGNKISYWISEPDAGVYYAMNKGIQKASGTYLLFINSGDVLYSNHSLQDFVKTSPTTDIVSGDVLIKSFFDQKEGLPNQPPDVLTARYLFENYLPHPATFIKRELFTRVGLYNTNRRIVADWEFFLKALLLHQATYQHIPVMVSTFISDGMSSDPANAELIQQEKAMVLSECFPYFVQDYQELAVCLGNQKAFQASTDKKVLGFFRKMYLVQVYEILSRYYAKAYKFLRKWLK